MKNQNIMFTRSILQMSKARFIRSVLALAGIALIMQVSLPRAQAYDLSSLNGNYADSYGGFVPPNPHSPPFASISSYSSFYEAGLYTFDGAGGFTARVVFNFGGGAILNASWSQNLTGGTYTVNANGTGTMSWDSGQHRRHFVIGDGEKQLRYVGTDPDTGFVASGSMVKQ
jgi:hypothetical protein